eukprot:3337937-Amphidinium_carterae.1
MRVSEFRVVFHSWGDQKERRLELGEGSKLALKCFNCLPVEAAVRTKRARSVTRCRSHSFPRRFCGSGCWPALSANNRIAREARFLQLRAHHLSYTLTWEKGRVTASFSACEKG